MTSSNQSKATVSAVLVFSMDVFIVFFCMFFFMMQVIYHLLPVFDFQAPDATFSAIFSFVLYSVIVTAYTLLHLCLQKSRKRLASYLQGTFFTFFIVAGGVSVFYTTRLQLYDTACPKALLLWVALFGLVTAICLPKRLVWRKVPWFFAVLLGFNFFASAMSRKTADVSNFLPRESSGVRVIHSIRDLEDLTDLQRWMSRFGFPFCLRQYGYLLLDESQNYLFVNDYNYRIQIGTLYKIRLEDAEVVSAFEGEAYFRDKVYEGKTGELITADWNRQRNLVYFFDASDLNQYTRIAVDFPYVQNLAVLPEQRLLITSELGWVEVLEARQRPVHEIRLPMHIQEIDLDRGKNLMAVASLAGPTIATVSLDKLEVLKERTAAFASWGVSIDPAGRRIFLTRVFMGDLLILDESTLETIAETPLDPGVRIVRYIPDRNLIVVGNYLNGKLYFIDGRDYRLLSTLWVGSRIRSIAYASLRDRLYVSTAVRVLEVDLAGR